MSWTELINGDKSDFLLNANQSLLPFPKKYDSLIHKKQLDFYSKPVYYIRVSNYSIIDKDPIYGIYYNSVFRRLNGKNDEIYNLNAEEGILTIDADNFNEYAEFFFSNVQGRHGRFYLITSKQEFESHIIDKEVTEYLKPDEQLDATTLSIEIPSHVDDLLESKGLDLSGDISLFEQESSEDSYFVIRQGHLIITFDNEWNFVSIAKSFTSSEDLLSLIEEDDTILLTEKTKQKGETVWLYSKNVFIIFKNSLFKARLGIYTNGKTELSNEELLLENIPFDEVFMEKLRNMKWA